MGEGTSYSDVSVAQLELYVELYWSMPVALEVVIEAKKIVEADLIDLGQDLLIAIQDEVLHLESLRLPHHL